MKFSKLALSINSSPTLKLVEKAKTLRESGKPIINLGIGEPSNYTPTSAVESAKARLESRNIKYTPTRGTTELVKAISNFTNEHYGIKPHHENILVTVGAKQGIFNALMSVLNPNDEVILFVPYWVSYPEMVKMVNGIPVYVEPNENDLTVNIDKVIKRISKSTKAVIINSPSNPSGVVYKPEFIADLVQLCEDNEIFLIMDDIYHQLVFGEIPWKPGYQYTNKNINSSYLIIINGISKSFGMTGFRIGWVIAAKELIDIMVNIQSQTTSGASVLTQDGALGALTGSKTEIISLQQTIRKNRQMILAELNEIPSIGLTTPGGTFYCLPDFSHYNKDSTILANYILDHANVAVVPGVSFGLEGYIRLSYAGDFYERSRRDAGRSRADPEGLPVL